MLPPIFTGRVVDTLLKSSQLQIVLYYIFGIMLCFVCKALFESIQEFIQVKIGLDVITDMQLRAFQSLHRAPMSFFTTAPRGDILYRLTHDVESIQELNNTVIPRFLQQIIGAAIAFAAVITLYWPAAIVMIFVFVVYLFPSFQLGKKVRKMGAIQRDMRADMYQHMQESIESVRLIRTFQTQADEVHKQEKKLSIWKKFSIRAALIGKVNWRLGNLFNIATPGVLMLIGGTAVWNGDISLGTLIACLGFIPTMFQPIRSLAENAMIIQQAIPALERIYEYFELPAEQGRDLPKLKNIQGHVDMKNIFFRYEGGETDILKGVSLSVEPGKHIGIVGASGGGKSTLIQLLLGLYEPQRGSIIVDGKNVKDIDRNSFRQQVGIVSQETFLLNSSLRTNLLYGKPDATHIELGKAVDVAGLTEWVQSLPDGYDTIVGERGLKLSGGQRQRVALARAILRQPPILIFDEATSSLDGETEERVQASLEQLIPGKTTITIAHRLATVKNADKIFLLEKGVIAEAGTHEQLLECRGKYYQLYMAQYRELEKEAVR